MTSTTPLNNRASQRRDRAPLSRADVPGLVWLRCALTITALLVAGSAGLNLHSSHAPVLYHNAKYNLTFSLPASWRGYSVLVQQWEGQTYLPAADKIVVTEHGPLIVLRHPRWKPNDRYQDIPILVFTSSQWQASHQGRFSIGAGGVEYEIGHNPKYVFAISSRFNADDSVKGWKEATGIVERNCPVNAPHLFPNILL